MAAETSVTAHQQKHYSRVQHVCADIAGVHSQHTRSSHHNTPRTAAITADTQQPSHHTHGRHHGTHAATITPHTAAITAHTHTAAITAHT